MVTNARQPLMMQTREQAGLTFELLPQALIGKQRLFQCHRGVETLVDGLINRTHTALPKLADDAIAALQNCFRRQHSGDYTRATLSDTSLECGALVWVS